MKVPDAAVRARKTEPTIVLFVILAAAASYYFTGVRFDNHLESVSATSRMLMDGTAARPYQYRALVPWLVKWASDEAPASPFRLYRTVEFISIFSLFLAERYYLSLFIKNRAASYALSFSVFYALPFNYVFGFSNPGVVHYTPVWYPCDMPAVLFFTCGLALIYKREWGWYYPLFALATFNRETTCFLTVAYLLTAAGKSSAAGILTHCAAQLVIWAGVKYFLYTLYAGNPGAPMGLNTFSFNLGLLRHPGDYPFLFSSLGFLWIPAVFLADRVGEGFLRRTLLLLVPFAAGMLFVGVVIELRVFGELIPVVLTPLMVVLYNSIKDRPVFKAMFT